MRKVSKEFDCETRGEEWWREAVKEQRETGQSETNKTLKLVLKSMTQWNRERIGTVFDPVSVKDQTSICSREGFGEHTGSRFRKRIRNMSHFYDLCLLCSTDQAVMIRSCVCLSQSVSGPQSNPSENALLATFMVVCVAFCVIYHVIVFSVQLYLHRDAHQQESCSIVFVSTVGYHV